MADSATAAAAASTNAGLRGTWRAALADVAVVTVTPFAGDEQRLIDKSGLERNLRHLVYGGARLLVAGGNTGEFAALSPDELIDVVRIHRSVAPQATLLAGIGYRLEDSIELGQRALAAGADGLLVHYPIHPYAGERGLVDYYARLAAALPDAPLVLYLRGRQLTANSIAEVCEGESIVGVKVGMPDADYFGELAAAAPDVAWLCGVAERWAAEFWQRGAIGFTSGLADFAPQLSLALFDALRDGDPGRAEGLASAVLPIEDLRARHSDANNVAVIKAALDILGLAGGPCRPPLSDLDDDEQQQLEVIMGSLELRR